MASSWPHRAPANPNSYPESVNPYARRALDQLGYEGKDAVGRDDGAAPSRSGSEAWRALPPVESYAPPQQYQQRLKSPEPGEITSSWTTPATGPDPPRRPSTHDISSRPSTSYATRPAPYAASTAHSDSRQPSSRTDLGKGRDDKDEAWRSNDPYHSRRRDGRGRSRDRPYRSPSRSRSRGHGRRGPSPNPRDGSPERDRRPRGSRRRSFSSDRGRSYSPDRRRSPSPKRRTTKQPLTKYLADFADAMHEALLCTSARSLARSHLSRLQSFTGPSSSTALAEAEERARRAERKVEDAMDTMNDAFAELIRRVTRDGAGPDPDAFERDAIKDRLARLESLSTSGALAPQPQQSSDHAPPHPQQPRPPPPPSAPAAMAAPPTPVTSVMPTQDVEMVEENQEVAQIEHKRRLAKDLLKDVLKRLDAAEAQRDALNERCDDLENWIWENAEYDTPVMSWELLEASRLNLHSIPPMERPKKRRKVEAADENEKQETTKVDAAVQTEPGPEVDPTPDDESKTAEQAEERAEEQAEAPKAVDPESGPIVASTGVDLSATVLAQNAELKAEVESLKATVTRLEGQWERWMQLNERRDRAVIKACLQQMTTGMKTMVNAEVSTRLEEFRQSPGNPKPPPTVPAVSTPTLPTSSPGINGLGLGVQGTNAPNGQMSLPAPPPRPAAPSRSYPPRGDTTPADPTPSPQLMQAAVDLQGPPKSLASGQRSSTGFSQLQAAVQPAKTSPNIPLAQVQWPQIQGQGRPSSTSDSLQQQQQQHPPQPQQHSLQHQGQPHSLQPQQHLPPPPPSGQGVSHHTPAQAQNSSLGRSSSVAVQPTFMQWFPSGQPGSGQRTQLPNGQPPTAPNPGSNAMENRSATAPPTVSELGGPQTPNHRALVDLVRRLAPREEVETWNRSMVQPMPPSPGQQQQ